MATPADPARSSLRVLLVTTEYPSPERPGGAAYLIRHIEALKTLGVDVDVLPFRSRGNPLNHWRAWRRMRRMMREKSYDVVHAHFGHASLIARMQWAKPLVITFHGSDVLGIVNAKGRYAWKGRLSTALSQLMSMTAAEVIVVAQHIGARLPRKDWTVIPLGVDLDAFRPLDRSEARRTLGWDQDVFTVVFAALHAKNPVKRLGLALSAMESLQALGKAELKIVEGSPPDMMPVYLSAADALLLTSAHEGSPTVVKEAMACNLPVVTTDVGDVRERLRDVSPGAIRPAEPQALALALHAIALSGQRSNGRDVIERQLTEDRVAGRVIGVYEKALRRRGRLELSPQGVP
ncbi:glycosyltransferase family 4 protein [Alsobacter sp. SYSU BS001988]